MGFRIICRGYYYYHLIGLSFCHLNEKLVRIFPFGSTVREFVCMFWPCYTSHLSWQSLMVLAPKLSCHSITSHNTPFFPFISYLDSPPNSPYSHSLGIHTHISLHHTLFSTHPGTSLTSQYIHMAPLVPRPPHTTPHASRIPPVYHSPQHTLHHHPHHGSPPPSPPLSPPHTSPRLTTPQDPWRHQVKVRGGQPHTPPLAQFPPV